MEQVVKDGSAAAGAVNDVENGMQNDDKGLTYMTLLCDDVMLSSTLVLAHSLRRQKSKAPFRVMVLPPVTAAAREKLRNGGVEELLEIDELSYPFPVTTAKRMMNKMCRYSKLHLWSMTQFRKIVYLDADVMVIKNIDDLFDHPELSATLDLGGTFNTGVFVAEPNLPVYEEMKATYSTSPSYNRGDQGFLNHYYTQTPNRTFHALPSTYNVLLRFQEYAIWPTIKEEVKVVHFTSETKPYTFWWAGHPFWERNFGEEWFYEWVRSARKIGEDSPSVESYNLLKPPNPIISDSIPSRDAETCEPFRNHSFTFPNIHQYSVLLSTTPKTKYQDVLRAVGLYDGNRLVHTIYILWRGGEGRFPDSLKNTMTSHKPTSTPRIEIIHANQTSRQTTLHPIESLQTKYILHVDVDQLDTNPVPAADTDFAFSQVRSDTFKTSYAGFFPSGHRIKAGTEGEEQVFEVVRDGIGGDDKVINGYSFLNLHTTLIPSRLLFMYTCLMPSRVRAYVEAREECWDVAVNMLLGGVTGQAPVVVGLEGGRGRRWNGQDGVDDECLTDLVRIWGGRMVLRWGDGVVSRYQSAE
ncbi:Exostoses (Multiple)-like 3 [Rhizophlyctis rosea]|nr:Exostoses (Multiple)-like 3 [Rhizophlyctis rosea]